MVLDPTNILHRLLPSHDDESFQCLRFIDWYGDTVFNRLQIPSFLAEWKGLSLKQAPIKNSTLSRGVARLAYDCQAETHLYLKVIGD